MVDVSGSLESRRSDPTARVHRRKPVPPVYGLECCHCRSRVSCHRSRFTPCRIRRIPCVRVRDLRPEISDPRNADESNIGELLLVEGVVEECEDADDLCLTPEFEREWWNRIRQVRDRETALHRMAAIVEVNPDRLVLEETDSRFDVRIDGRRVGGWNSQAAVLADLAVEPTLGEWLSDWEQIDGENRTQLIASMRIFLERCPSCDGPLDSVEDTLSTCCRDDVTTVTVDCQECGGRVFGGRHR